MKEVKVKSDKVEIKPILDLEKVLDVELKGILEELEVEALNIVVSELAEFLGLEIKNIGTELNQYPHKSKLVSLVSAIALGYVEDKKKYLTRIFTKSIDR